MVELTLISHRSGKILVDSGSTVQDPRLLQERTIAIQNLTKLAKKKKRGSVVRGYFCHWYMLSGEILYLTICGKHYPGKLSSLFIEEVASDFEKIYKNAKDSHLQNFGSAIRRKEKLYSSSDFQVNNWSLIVRCSNAEILVQTFDDEFRPDEKHRKEAMSVLLQQNETSSQISVPIGPYHLHCTIEEGIACGTMCGKLYPSKVAVDFLDMLRNEFGTHFGTRASNSKSLVSLSSFGMTRVINMYWDTRSLRIANVDAESKNLKGADKQMTHEEKNIGEMPGPLKIADGDIQLLDKKNNKDGYFKIKAEDGKSCFELDLKIYEDLFPHQREGLKWLWSLHCQGKGGILADDMGLGKTRLVLTFLVGLFHSKLITHALVIVPRTIIAQWEQAVLESGLGSISRVYTSANLKSHQQALRYIMNQGGLLITSYEIVRDHHDLVVDGITWAYIFLDEGHRLKNMDSRISKVLNNVECSHKIVVTGTPIQNDLMEFYALFNLCHPHMLGSETLFRKNFSEPIQSGKYKDSTSNQIRIAIKVAQELYALVAPYMLRRTKQILIVSKRLPRKQEFTVWLKMTPSQVQLFEKFVGIPNYKISGAALAASQVAREICNHPLILKQSESLERNGLAASYVERLLQLIPVEENIQSSCKIIFLLYLVKELLSKDHKILIFSQSRPMLKIVEGALLDALNLTKDQLMRMDGDTPQKDRDEMIQVFENNKTKTPPDNRYKNARIFLLTTYVGGVGLNLTRATRVILLDPAKNPSTDNQSVDRAYRLGQKKNVIVYRLMTCGTIEEHTYREQILKGELSSAVIENKNCQRSMSKEKHRVLIVPKGGFDISVTHDEIQELFDDSGLYMRREIRFLRENDVVYDVTNHSSLFTIEETSPMSSESGSSPRKTVLQRVYNTKKSEIVIGGEVHALHPREKEDWVAYAGPEGPSDCRARGCTKKALGSKLSIRTEAGKAAEPSGTGNESRKFGGQFDPGKKPG